MNYEAFLSLAQSRRSIRRFAERAVPRTELLRLFEAARWAPSNHNRQPWKFVVWEDKQRIVRLAEKVGARLSEKLKELPAVASSYSAEFSRYATFFATAPVLIVVLHKRPASFSAVWLENVPQADLVSGEPLSAAMAVQNLLLAAHTCGLGACVLTAPLVVKDLFADELPPPAGHELTCLVAVGYPAETPAAPRRKSIEQIVEFREDPSK
jgi:coenzyme F420-0:L-glutamate ligase / coenzyme F420-1:gamma-L-glutamate ligase